MTSAPASDGSTAPNSVNPADPADPATVIMFDLDGTITDSYPGIAASFLHALRELGEPEPPKEFLSRIVGPPLIDTMREMGLSPERAAAGVRHYRERYDEIGWRENSVFDGMPSMLADLAATGRTLTLATSKNEVIARKILDHFTISEYFTEIGGADDSIGRLSKAAVVAEVLGRLRVDGLLGSGQAARPVVMIGDRSHDVDGAASCQVPTVGVKWGYAHAGELEAAHERTGAGEDQRWIVDSVPQLRKVLGV